MKKLFSLILVASLFFGTLMFTGCKNDAGPTDFEARGTYYYLVEESELWDIIYECDNKFYIPYAYRIDKEPYYLIFNDITPVEESKYDLIRDAIKSLSKTKAFSKTTEIEGFTSNYSINIDNKVYAILLKSQLPE